jgi:hypothetical protein
MILLAAKNAWLEKSSQAFAIERSDWTRGSNESGHGI